MQVDVALLPSLLTDRHTFGRSIVVFDVLRATTTMTAALTAGVAEIRIYPTIESAAAAAGPASPTRLLCGETRCLPPTGFDLGNSPAAFGPAHRGRVMHMSTSNGTRAIVAARPAGRIYIGALVNAASVAAALLRDRRDATLLCAGTSGAVALEDVLGAGAVLDALEVSGGAPALQSDAALLARDLFRTNRHDLRRALASAQGGRNVVAAGLSADIDYAARLDALDLVGLINDPAAVPPVVRAIPG